MYLISAVTTYTSEPVQPNQPQETVKPTLPQETLRPTLSQETLQPTPQSTGTAPLPGGSHAPIVAGVVVIVVVVLLVVVIGVFVLVIILVRARRKKQQSEVEKFQSAMLENDNIELTLVKLRQEENDDQLDNPHYVNPHVYAKPAGQSEKPPEKNSEEENAEDKQPKSVSNGNVKNNPDGDQPGFSKVSDTIQPLYSAVQKTSPQIPRKSSELYADLKTEKEANTDLPVYAAVVKEEPPTVPSKSEELTEYLESRNQPSNLTSEYDHVSTTPVPADSEYALPAKPPRLVALSNPIFEGMESNPVYKSVDELHDPRNVPQETISDNIYTLPDTTCSQTVEVDHGMLEVVYSEPIKPSLFTDAVESPNSSKLWEDLQPYAPIYTVPVAPPQGEEMPLEVLISNIREIRELGTGLFGQVVLAETVGLSRKDLKLSESDNDKGKSTFVAVKKLKPNAPKTTKEAFEKEVKFMARLDNRNVIRMLGVCYEVTPFIMMEYMEKGDLNQYLKRFNLVTSTDSELQGEDQITTGILVRMTTQIASAMKYLASRNFVHRDLATRNCLVGPNYLVKIADFGMSRSLYESHYYIIHGHAVLPVRWMSTECFYGKFSQKSDVWAFGVTMWEVFTLVKEQPYADMSDQDVIKDAIKGTSRKLLAKPAACPPEVYKIMLTCWAHDPSKRATFEELFRMLSSISSSD